MKCRFGEAIEALAKTVYCLREPIFDFPHDFAMDVFAGNLLAVGRPRAVMLRWSRGSRSMPTCTCGRSRAGPCRQAAARDRAAIWQSE